MDNYQLWLAYETELASYLEQKATPEELHKRTELKISQELSKTFAIAASDNYVANNSKSARIELAKRFFVFALVSVCLAAVLLFFVGNKYKSQAVTKVEVTQPQQP